MHPKPRHALLGAAAAPPPASARRSPVVAGGVTKGNTGPLPGIRVRAVAA